ncbi:MAG: hypothetical protein DI547_15705 [Sphingobium sp.]|jgi:hypothetical protein|nr:MAG: hypothetical protein DI547_15705 [Sphingobium sp.]
MLNRFFLDHPRSVGESYTTHFGVATRFGLRMIVGGLACLVHGVIPVACVKTGSTTVRRLYADMQPRSERADPSHDGDTRFLPEYEI